MTRRTKSTPTQLVEIIGSRQQGYANIIGNTFDQIKSWRMLGRETNNGKLRQLDSTATRK